MLRNMKKIKRSNKFWLYGGDGDVENVIILIVQNTIVIKLLLSIFTYFIHTQVLIYTGLSVIQELCEDTTTSVIHQFNKNKIA